MDYAVFETVILQRMWIVVAVCAIVIAVAVFGLMYLFKNPPEKTESLGDKIEHGVLVGMACIALVGATVFGGITTYLSLFDVKHQAYVVVEGSFDIVYDSKTPNRYSSILLSDGTRLDYSNTWIREGQYSGRVVYAQKTELVLEVVLY